ncbi:MAG: 5-(carboxyamino)imidazole ribonucleotide mutase [Candidatus Diapherotrites archaeon]|nr:5-(carboxyamino)imidazole ribonucleotide mutase [Candidatus Diapherotrites archaeon]
MKVLVAMGSKSDRKILDKAVKILDEFEIPYEFELVSSHRTPDKVDVVAERIEKEFDVCIAIAGLSAALPGDIAARTTKPVIGCPVDVKLGGLDALYSIVQMPPGTPLACVGIDRGENAALLAASILSISNMQVRQKILEYRKKRREEY